MPDKEIKADSIVGVISDTHGLLRPQALEALRGCDLILHAGDIGGRAIVKALGAIAPVVAVRGNIDRGEWAQTLPEWEVVEVSGVCIYMLHDVKDLNINPEAAGFQAVISGHSHKPTLKEHEGVLYINPGSAGPRRFKLPISVCRLRVTGNTVSGELVELSI
jgi:uncharacterized protein